MLPLGSLMIRWGIRLDESWLFWQRGGAVPQSVSFWWQTDLISFQLTVGCAELGPPSLIRHLRILRIGQFAHIATAPEIWSTNRESAATVSCSQRFLLRSSLHSLACPPPYHHHPPPPHPSVLLQPQSIPEGGKVGSSLKVTNRFSHSLHSRTWI